jgi:hypothetical protein
MAQPAKNYSWWFVGIQPWRNQRRITRGGLWGHNHGATSEELLVVVCGDTNHGAMVFIINVAA